MRTHLKRFDDGLARGETAVAAFVLMSMIVLAFIQAVLSNLASNGIEWANAGLETFHWIDAILQKGTLWLAFLGASLATHADKHIAVDALARVVPKHIERVMKIIVNLGAGLTSLALANVFYAAVLIAGQERPLRYEVMVDMGTAHVCDGSAQSLVDAGIARPDVFCAVRSFLNTLGAPMETPESALQLIVPVMFVIIGVRMLVRAVATTFQPKSEAGSEEGTA